MTGWFGTPANPLGAVYEGGMVLAGQGGSFDGWARGMGNVIVGSSGIVQLTAGTQYGVYLVGVYGANPTAALSVNNWVRTAAQPYPVLSPTATIFWEPSFSPVPRLEISITQLD